MLSYQLAMFGGHRRCGSEDMMYLAVERQDSICLLKSTNSVYLCLKHMVRNYITN